MAFDSIQKYHKLAKDLGITDKSVAVKQSVVDSALETATVNSVWNSNKSDTTSSSGNSQLSFAESSSVFNDDYKKAVKAIKTVTTIQTIGQVANTLGNLFGANFSSNSGNNIFGTTSNTNQKGNVSVQQQSTTPDVSAATKQTVMQNAVNKTIKDLDISNDLDKAIAKFDKKGGNEKATANLNQELSTAQTDRSKLASKYAEQTSVINSAKTQKEAVDAEIKELKSTQTSQQKAVDDAKQAIIDEADKKIGELDEDDKSQKDIISKSQKKVSDAQTKLKTDLSAQDKIISDATPKLQAMKTVQSTDAMGNVVTQQVPDTETRNAAQKAIDAAKAQKEKLQDAFNALKEQEECADDSVQKTATAKIAANAEARAEQEAIKANPQSEELTGLRGALEDIITTLSEKQAESDKFKDTIDQASLIQQTCQQQMSTLSSKIIQAQNLLAQKA